MSARASVSLTDVVDPTIWVKEKLTVALGAPTEGAEPPLRLLISALRSIHAELMRRPERDRPWVSVLAVVFQAGDGVLVSAGDCPCFRYRAGLLSRLKRPGEGGGGDGAPRGALGSEQQIRIEVVPLRPEPGDVYVMSTRALRDGELQALAGALAAARDGAQLLRAGVEGSSDRGRLAIRVLGAGEDASLAERARSLADAPAGESAGPIGAANLAAEGAMSPFEIAPIEPAASFEAGPEAPAADAPDLAAGDDTEPVPRGALDAPAPAASDEPLHAGAAGMPAFSFDDLPDEPEAPAVAVASDADPSAIDGSASAEGDPTAPLDRGASAAPAPPRGLAPIEEERPWYEPLALWGGGALAIIALALLLRAILPGIMGTRDAKERAAATAPTGGTVDILSEPPGATVRVDGEALEGRTPLTAVSLDPGLHRVELDWGASGTWRDTLEVTAGSRLVLHPAIYGSAVFRASDPARVLDVYVDGEYEGTTPLTIDRLVVGRHLVRFGGPGLTTTAQEVDVLRDAPVELVGNAGAVPEKGSLTVRSAVLTDTGFQPGKNDPVWVDGVARGATPFTMDLAPGTHSVRVVRRDFPAQVTVIDVKSGGEHFVSAEFGADSQPPISLDPPSSISISNPLPVTVSLPPEEWDASVGLWLYAAAPGGTFQAKRMTKLEDGERTYAGLLPPEVLRNAAKKVRYYVKATGASGREYYSEIVTVPVRE